jgi:hypothetical protein
METWNHPLYVISGTNIKFKKIQQNDEINCQGIFLLALMSNCPAKDVGYGKWLEYENKFVIKTTLIAQTREMLTLEKFLKNSKMKYSIVKKGKT